MEITRTWKGRQGILERLGPDGESENEDPTTRIDLAMTLEGIIEGESIDLCDQLTGDRGTGLLRYGQLADDSQSSITQTDSQTKQAYHCAFTDFPEAFGKRTSL